MSPFCFLHKLIQVIQFLTDDRNILSLRCSISKQILHSLLSLMKGFCKFPPRIHFFSPHLLVRILLVQLKHSFVVRGSTCAALCPSDTEFPWRQVRPSASNEDMKRWTTALHSPHLRTPTMTSPAVTALTAVTASTPLPALHLPVRNSRRHTLKAIHSKTHSNSSLAKVFNNSCVTSHPKSPPPPFFTPQPPPSSDSTSRRRGGNGYVLMW